METENPKDLLVQYTISIGRNGDITNDTLCFGNSFADVYRAFIAIREEVERQIVERRNCPFNPKNPQPPVFDGPGAAPKSDFMVRSNDVGEGMGMNWLEMQRLRMAEWGAIWWRGSYNTENPTQWMLEGWLVRPDEAPEFLDWERPEVHG